MKKINFPILPAIFVILMLGFAFLTYNDIITQNRKNATIDSLNIEFDKYDSLCDYYFSKYSPGCQIDTFFYYSTKAGQCIDKMIELNNERMRLTH